MTQLFSISHIHPPATTVTCFTVSLTSQQLEPVLYFRERKFFFQINTREMPYEKFMGSFYAICDNAMNTL